MSEIEELLNGLYDILGEDKYKLAKGKWKIESIPDVVVTSFYHFATVGTTAWKICRTLEGKGIAENIAERCFWGGVVHDFEKLRTTRTDFLEKVAERSGLEMSLLKELSTLAESLAGANREKRVISYSLALADYWASQRSLSTYLPSANRYEMAFRYLEGFGLQVVPLFSGLPKAIMAGVSEKLVEILRRNGWEPLILYSDGILLLGDKDSGRISREEVVTAIYEVLEEALVGGESQKQVMEKGLKWLSEFGAKVENYLYYDEEELRKEVIKLLESDERKDRKKLIPLLSVLLIKGLKEDAEKLIQEIIKRKRTYQFKSLLGEPFYFAEITKMGLQHEFKKLLLDKWKGGAKSEAIAYLAFAQALYDKNKQKGIAKEVVEIRKTPYAPVVFGETFAKLYIELEPLNEDEFIEKINDLLNAEMPNKVKEEELWGFAEYLACSTILSPILEGKCKERKPVSRCTICGAPIFSKKYEFWKYYSFARGGKGGVEIYNPRLGLFKRIENVKKDRFICPACAYEAHLLNKRLSYPFIAYAVHPATSIEVMDYITKKLISITSYSIYDLCTDIQEEGESEEYYVVDYAHALILLRIEGLKADEKGFGAHGSAIAKFLAYAGFLLEAGGGGQVVLSWELPSGIVSSPVSAPHPPNWLTELTHLSLGKADSLNPLIHGLKAWAYKVCSIRDINELRDTFFDSDLVPHPTLALLVPPRSYRIDHQNLAAFLKYFSSILKEVELMEKSLEEENRLLPRLWAYAYAIGNAIKENEVSLSKHKVQGPLRTALFRLADYLEVGLKEEDVIELAVGAAQEDAERSLGNVNIEGAVKSILKFIVKYIKEMSPSKRRLFFEDLLDVTYLLTRKVLKGDGK